MNTKRDLDKRLLTLFPVRLLKDYFKSSEASDALYEDILKKYESNEIQDFAIKNLEMTKQHIYIFALKQSTKRHSLNDENFRYSIVRQSSQNGHEFTIIPTVDFKVVLSNPFEEVTINFYQPFIITLSDKHLIFYATILEKNMTNQFPKNREVLKVEKVNDEKLVIQTICKHFEEFKPSICDLSKGIKNLWDSGIVDSKYAKWKKDRSTTTETMDENFTLKKQYPEIFHDLLRSHLKKTSFKYLNNDENLPDHFTIDPSEGHISIPMYPKNENQNKNVVREIVSKN